MEALTHTHWFLLALGALIMGMSKGGIPGAGNLTVAIFALVLEDA
ncbi:MAG: sulfite exporter TauE/SafE family protein, partial [Opitutae bacterium]|nr:sulfite exporter TauE/SafE family protein [Opitutae bacterium]